MSYSPEDYTLIHEPDYFNKFDYEGDKDFPDITDDREPSYGETL